MATPSEHRTTGEARQRYGGLEALAWIDYEAAEPTLTGFENSDLVHKTRLTVIVDVVPGDPEEGEA